MAYRKQTQFIITDDDGFDFAPVNLSKSTENGEPVISVEQDGSVIELSLTMAKDLSATLELIRADH